MVSKEITIYLLPATILPQGYQNINIAIAWLVGQVQIEV
jgi:hypothetical protein